MVRFQIGYRHVDGGIRGYIGYGFADYSARDNAIAKIREACKQSGEDCVLTGPGCRAIVDKASCRKGEYEALLGQWRRIRKALKDSGASIY